jgi:hypothetical protein
MNADNPRWMDDALVLSDALQERGPPALGRDLAAFVRKVEYFRRAESGQPPGRKARGRKYVTPPTTKEYMTLGRRIKAVLDELEKPKQIRWYADRDILTPVEVLDVINPKEGILLICKLAGKKKGSTHYMYERETRAHPQDIIDEDKRPYQRYRYAVGAMRFASP